MNFIDLLNEPRACQAVIRWMFEGDDFLGSGLRFESIQKDWPKFWKALGKFSESQSIKSRLREAEAVFISKFGADMLYFNFSKLKASANLRIAGPHLLRIVVYKNLEVDIKRR